MAGSGINLYQYADSDPIDYIDPLGLESVWEEAGNAITGFGDTVSGGITTEIRGALNIGQPDFSSSAYEGGADAGILAATLTPGDEEAAAADVAEEGLDGSYRLSLGTSRAPSINTPPTGQPIHVT